MDVADVFWLFARLAEGASKLVSTLWARRSPGLVSGFLGWVLVCATAYGGVWLAGYFVPVPEREATPAVQLAGGTATTADPARNKPEAARERPRNEGGGQVTVTQAETNTAAKVPLYVVVAFLAALVFWLVWAMGQLRDSDAFRAAVSAWARPLGRILDTPRDWRRFQNLARFQAMRLRVERGEAGIGFAQGWHKLLAGLAAWVRRQPSPVDRTEQDEGLIVGLLALRVLAQGEDWTCFQAAHSALLAGEAQSDVLDAWEEGSSRPEQLAAVLAGIPPVSDPEADVYTEAQKATLERLKQSVPEKDPDLRAFLTRVGQMKRTDLHRLPPALADHLAASLPELEDQALQEALRTLCAGSPTARLLLELAATGVFESSPVVSGELRSVGTE